MNFWKLVIVFLLVAVGIWFVATHKNEASSLTAINSVQEFENIVNEKSGVVLVDFYWTTCPPCKALAPILDKLSKEYAGKVSFYKAERSKAPDLMARFKVNAFPTVMIFKNGKVVDEWKGLREAPVIRAKLDKAIGQAEKSETK